MKGKSGRRGFCAAVVVGSLAGCVGVLGRDRERIAGVRSQAPNEREWNLDLGRRDRIILEYRPSTDEPSRVVIEGPNGEVLLDETLTEQDRVTYRADESGEYTVRFEWGSRARVDLYLES